MRSRTHQPVIETVEMHTGGEPVRIVKSGYPPIPGETILAKRRYAREHLDHLRRFLIFEPRGHFDMYGVIPVEPDHPEADLAVLFMHNEGYSTMCGHAVIALARWAVDTGRVRRTKPEARVNIQCPCGLVRARLLTEGEWAGEARFESVPAFAYALDRTVEVAGLGARRSATRDLVDAASRVTEAVKLQVPIAHPDDPDLGFLYGTILTDGADSWSERPTANICVFAEREVDRSPTGSGVTARIAVQLARGLIGMGQERRFESITGAIFTGQAVARGKVGRFDSVTVEVGGRACYTGEARFTLEEGDALGAGFLLRQQARPDSIEAGERSSGGG
jgi:proline racemase